jgi:hypothetical protein
MALGFMIAGLISAMLAGLATLVLDQPWWVVLASYSASGVAAVLAIALAVAVALCLKGHICGDARA